MFMKLAAGIALLFTAAVPASADQMIWTLRSNYPYNVQVEFYSQYRDAAWPGSDRAYDLNDYNDHQYRLNCINGEKICYGAWVTGSGGRYWGVGPNDKYNCGNCCATCGESHPSYTLDE